MSHLVLELGACSEEGGRQVRFQMGYCRGKGVWVRVEKLVAVD